jgi:predicted HTH transcriptional regulator
MSDYIKKLIAEGEHQMLDFKFEISDSRKIARTLVAFANTDGGRVLVGVKDNGVIAGVRTEEEYYMVEGASRLYCNPEIPLKIRQWTVDGKKVLEVTVFSGRKKPYTAMDEHGSWKAYIRQRDENFLAGRVTMKLWEREVAAEGAFLRIGHAESALLKYLETNPWVTLSRFRKLAGIHRDEAEDILVSFIMLGILELQHVEQDILYRLRPGYEKVLEDIRSSS